MPHWMIILISLSVYGGPSEEHRVRVYVNNAAQCEAHIGPEVAKARADFVEKFKIKIGTLVASVANCWEDYELPTEN